MKAPIILDTWKRFFRFPVEVATVLTQLTTFSGFLPQGAYEHWIGELDLLGY